MDKTQELIKSLAEELLSQLTISADVSVSEQDGAIWVQIESEEKGILIGHHGRSLEAIQIILGQMVFKKLGTWVRVVVSVGDYRQRRQEQLLELARSSSERVKTTNTPVILTDLTPAERRIIHMQLSVDPLVVSESEGEGRDRKLVIKPRA